MDKSKFVIDPHLDSEGFKVEPVTVTVPAVGRTLPGKVTRLPL